MKRAAVAVSIAVLVAGCGGSSPAAPDSSSSIVALGSQVLRIALATTCGAPQGVLPMIYTRVTVSRSGSGWVATAGSAAAGDVQVRFQQSGAALVAGSMPVAGSVTATAVHMPELLTLPAYDLRANFGSDGRTLIQGVAFAAGSLNASAAGLDGTGIGSFTVTNGTGQSCTATSFSWSIFPPS